MHPGSPLYDTAANSFPGFVRITSARIWLRFVKEALATLPAMRLHPLNAGC